MIEFACGFSWGDNFLIVFVSFCEFKYATRPSVVQGQIHHLTTIHRAHCASTALPNRYTTEYLDTDFRLRTSTCHPRGSCNAYRVEGARGK